MHQRGGDEKKAMFSCSGSEVLREGKKEGFRKTHSTLVFSSSLEHRKEVSMAEAGPASTAADGSLIAVIGDEVRVACG